MDKSKFSLTLRFYKEVKETIVKINKGKSTSIIYNWFMSRTMRRKAEDQATSKVD